MGLARGSNTKMRVKSPPPPRHVRSTEGGPAGRVLISTAVGVTLAVSMCSGLYLFEHKGHVSFTLHPGFPRRGSIIMNRVQLM